MVAYHEDIQVNMGSKSC